MRRPDPLSGCTGSAQHSCSPHGTAPRRICSRCVIRGRGNGNEGHHGDYPLLCDPVAQQSRPRGRHRLLSHVPDRLQDSWLCIATRLSDSLPWSARKQHHVPLADSAVALSAIPVSLIGISLDYSSIVAGASLIVLGGPKGEIRSPDSPWLLPSSHHRFPSHSHPLPPMESRV